MFWWVTNAENYPRCFKKKKGQSKYMSVRKQLTQHCLFIVWFEPLY